MDLSSLEELVDNSKNKELELVYLMTKNYDDINCERKTGNTPLIQLALCKDFRDTLEVAQILITDPNLNMDYQNKHDRTALSYACDVGNYTMVDFLLVNGADPDLQNENGRTALMYVCNKQFYFPHRKKAYIGLVFNEWGHYKDIASHDELATRQVFYKDNFDLIKLLVEHGCDLNLVDKSGHSALSYCVKRKKDKPLEYLIKKGANLDLPVIDTTLLIHFINKGNWELFEYIVERVDDVDQTDNHFTSPLMHAIATTDLKMVDRLLMKGADVNLFDDKMHTALLYAINLCQNVDNQKIIIRNLLLLDCDTFGVDDELIKQLKHGIAISWSFDTNKTYPFFIREQVRTVLLLARSTKNYQTGFSDLPNELLDMVYRKLV